MEIQFLILIFLSIITARLLDKRYKVASIAHAVLFIFVSFVISVCSDWEPLVNIYTNWMGEEYYLSLKEALEDSELYLNSGLSTITLLEVIIFIFVPLLSIFTIVEEIRERLKQARVKRNFSLCKPIITNLYPIKDFKHTENKIFLTFGHLLN